MSVVLADTSVWIEHFRKANEALQTLFSAHQVLCHPMVLIEIACGTPPALWTLDKNLRALAARFNVLLG